MSVKFKKTCNSSFFKNSYHYYIDDLPVSADYFYKEFWKQSMRGFPQQIDETTPVYYLKQAQEFIDQLKRDDKPARPAPGYYVGTAEDINRLKLKRDNLGSNYGQSKNNLRQNKSKDYTEEIPGRTAWETESVKDFFVNGGALEGKTEAKTDLPDASPAPDNTLPVHRVVVMVNRKASISDGEVKKAFGPYVHIIHFDGQQRDPAYHVIQS